MNCNLVVFGGRLTRDVQLKYLPNQTPVAEFGIASNKFWKDDSGEKRESACFVDVVVFGPTAEFVNKHFIKGSEILCVGELKYDSWEDKGGGGKRSKLLLKAHSVEFAGPNLTRTGNDEIPTL